MPQKTPETPDSGADGAAAKPVAEALQPMAAFTAGIEPYWQTTQTVWSGCIAVQGEVAQFLQARVQRDIALQRTLIACNTPSDAFEALAAFMQETVDNYMTEMNKLGAMALENTNRAVNGHAKTAA